jgi:putative transposase
VAILRGRRRSRHGTTTLFAGLQIVDGEVISQGKARHRRQEVVSGLIHLDANVLKDLALQLSTGNYVSYRHPEVKG